MQEVGATCVPNQYGQRRARLACFAAGVIYVKTRMYLLPDVPVDVTQMSDGP